MDSARTLRLTQAEVEKQLKSLPTLPSIVGELMSLDANADDFSARVIEIAEREPALAARLLSVANGAVSAPTKPILTLREALLRLGAKRVAILITSFALLRVFVPTTPAQRGLWRHALETAVAAQVIAGASSWGIDTRQAYVAGLLHDIGRFVMFEYDPQDFGSVEGADWNAPQSLIASERARCGIDHTEVGCMAARTWWLPRVLIEVIRLHHDHGSLEGKTPAAAVPMIRIVQQADSLSCLFRRESEPLHGQEESARIGKLERACICPSWGEPPLSAQALSALVPVVHQKSEEQIASLGLRGAHG